MLRIPFLLLLLSVLIGADLPSKPQYEPKEESRAYFTFFDLPDGEATLLKSDRNQYYLINTGEANSYDQLVEELDRLGVKKLRAIILTGQTTDYCGNLSDLLEQYNVNNVYHTGDLQTTCIKEADIPITRWYEGDKVMLDGVSLRVVYTDDQQMALHLSFYETGIIFFAKGDMEEEIHISKKDLSFQIIKIGAYGTGNSPSERFLEKTDPHMAVVFTRKGNSVNDGLIERMHGFWMDVYSLRQTGTTTIEIRKEQYSVPSD